MIKVLKALAVLASAAFFFVVLLIGMVLLVAVALQPEAKEVEADSMLVLDLGITITDRPVREDPGRLLEAMVSGELEETVSLRSVLENLREARQDGNVAGLLIRGNWGMGDYGNSYATLAEVRRAIERFGESKRTVALVEGDGLRELYIKTAAQEVIVDRDGLADFRGLRAERMYVGEALERIGVGVQSVALKDYKTAVETFERGDMSAEEREQLELVLDEFWYALVGEIAESRGLAAEDLDRWAGEQLVWDAEELVEAGLADRVMEGSEWVEALAEVSSWDAEAMSFRQFEFMEYVDLGAAPVETAMAELRGGNRVGVVYAEGPVVAGEGGDFDVGGQRMVRFLREMRKEDEVKAVVLRINSPGGSAVAANRIMRELRLLNEKKPVVVSMGGVAASAGYLMAAPAEEIHVEATTLTGSIGVVILLPNVETLAEKVSVNFDGVETHRFAGTYSLAREKTEAEMEQVREMAEGFYEEFLEAVAAGRGMAMEEVRAVAQGRIWSGPAAKERGLADAVGGLEGAIQRAADLAGIGDEYEILERPRGRTLEEAIAESFADLRSRPVGTAAGPASIWEQMRGQAEQYWRFLSSLNDPYGVYAILPYSLRIE